MSLTTALISTDYWKACVRTVRTAITGLEKLSDADVATFLNSHPSVIAYTTGMVTVWTAAMVHEVRSAII